MAREVLGRTSARRIARGSPEMRSRRAWSYRRGGRRDSGRRSRRCAPRRRSLPRRDRRRGRIARGRSASRDTCSMNAAIAGAMWRTPKLTPHEMRSVPRGTMAPAPADASASSRSAMSCTHRSWKARPASVSESLRVVRCRSRASRCVSRSATWRETEETETSSRSAARAKLPVSTTLTKAAMAVKRSMRRLLHISQ